MSNALLLPPPLARDPRSVALAEVAARLSGVDVAPVLVYLIDEVDASALPLLAQQFRVAGESWGLARSDDDRRALIKSAIEIKRHLGTPWAIEQMLQVLDLPGELQEWFEYGGRPYHFKVRIDLAGRGITEETYAALVKLIRLCQRKSARLEALSIITSLSSTTPRIAAAVVSGETTTIYPFIKTDTKVASPIYRACGVQFVEITTIYPRSAAWPMQ